MFKKCQILNNTCTYCKYNEVIFNNLKRYISSGYHCNALYLVRSKSLKVPPTWATGGGAGGLRGSGLL